MIRIFILILGFFSVASTSAHAQLRPMVYTEKTIDAPIERVWVDWTTEDGLERFLAPKVKVKAEPGGRYAIYFDPDAPKGERGSDDGIVLGLQNPETGPRMISVSWAMPPYMAEIRPHMTALQIWFVPVNNTTTRVRLFHTGFGDSPAWREGRNYFAKTWPDVLALYEESLDEIRSE